MVRRVARYAGNIVLGMHGIERVHVLRASGVAGHATVVDFLGSVFLEVENFGLIATALDVSSAGTVAAFASLARLAAFGIQRGPPVRSLLPVVVDIFMASLASLCSDIIDLGGGAARNCVRDRCHIGMDGLALVEARCGSRSGHRHSRKNRCKKRPRNCATPPIFHRTLQWISLD